MDYQLWTDLIQGAGLLGLGLLWLASTIRFERLRRRVDALYELDDDEVID